MVYNLKNPIKIAGFDKDKFDVIEKIDLNIEDFSLKDLGKVEKIFFESGNIPNSNILGKEFTVGYQTALLTVLLKKQNPGIKLERTDIEKIKGEDARNLLWILKYQQIKTISAIDLESAGESEDKNNENPEA